MRAARIVLATSFAFSLVLDGCDYVDPTLSTRPIRTPVSMNLTSAEAPLAPDDVAIVPAVRTLLARDPAVSLLAIDVASRGGIVTLSGNVDSILARRRAVRIASTVRGVRAVVDQTAVVPVDRPDADVVRDVGAAFAMDPVTRGRDLQIDVTADVVTIRGHVDSDLARGLVEDVAAGVLGVVAVDDRMVLSANPPGDRVLEEEVARVLRDDVWLGQPPVDVTVRDGVARIVGTIGTAEQRDRAVVIARVPGVHDVDARELVLGGALGFGMRRPLREAPPSDADLATTLANAYVVDQRIVTTSLRFQVDRGIITLTGIVASGPARHVAVSDAENVVGSRGVNDGVKVRPVPGLSDEDIRQAVLATLLEDPILSNRPIEILVHQGQVLLSGRVGSSYERERATLRVDLVPGVVSVQNALSPPPSTVPRPTP